MATGAAQAVPTATGGEAPPAEKAAFLQALNAELRKFRLSPKDLVNGPQGASGVNPKAHAALLNALRKTGYTVKLLSDDEASGAATSPDGKRRMKIADPFVDNEKAHDGITYWTTDGVAMDNRTRKPRVWSK